ncbi:hypothetical protein F4813DRAFT_350022 [Daldinia decipiens]|uniref:uncharacterized protein n=1 Tax=Daldinia decipiens TaxID=326647 RepID=UPI0020C43FA0|nr:uncharacterized protein F4813DRAFT_350022 [Daldinia decipiens]KAI1660454.1 hypothetical protein F4813DRAFT_350022 [Daldinia decipiens]
MSPQSELSSPTNTTSPRRLSIASEKTLVDMLSRKEDASEEKYQGSNDYRKSSSDVKTLARSSSLLSKMGKAIEKVGSKLQEKDINSRPRGSRPAPDGYPDTQFMWQALAETRL